MTWLATEFIVYPSHHFSHRRSHAMYYWEYISFRRNKKTLEAFHHKDHLPEQAAALQVLPDYSQYTLQLRQNLNSITKALRNNKIIYMWKYPTKLCVTHQGSTSHITTMEEGIRLLQQWGIVPDPPNSHPSCASPSPNRIQSDWQVVSGRSKTSHRQA